MDRSVKDLFEVEAIAMKDIAKDHELGFKIPDYQRAYQWDNEKILRLYSDIVNGLYRLTETKKESPNTSVYTFLGAIILVKQDQDSVEPAFEGNSLEVIDGQQRLTTLVLLACAVSDILNVKYHDLNLTGLSRSTKEWLQKEINYWRECMYSCSFGEQRITRKSTFPFPRIVRSEDSRGKEFKDTEYRSAIAKFLFEYDRHWDSKESNLFKIPTMNNDLPSRNLHSNYQGISKLIHNVSNSDWYKDNDPDMFEIQWVLNRCSKRLFEKLPPSESEKGRVLNEILRLEDAVVHDVVRTLIFAAYYYKYITLTKVVAVDEYSAFDIFDALNTTGEPLTALETLKPTVLKYEHTRSKQRHKSSEASDTFAKVENHLEKILGAKEHLRQEETKELVITFAMYWSGKKLSKDLAIQRLYLRQQFQDACGRRIQQEEFSNAFLDSLRKVTKFRRYYWSPEGISEINQFHSEEIVDEVKLLVSFIYSMKSSLTLPILCRYWYERKILKTGRNDFVEVLRALVAFIVLRRGYTGNTDGIDADFRKVMESLCRIQSVEDMPREVVDLKIDLKSLLEKKLGSDIDDRKHWVSNCSILPLYKFSRPLVRFMILAANDDAEPSQSQLGLLQQKVKRIRPLGERGFLDIGLWNNEGYRTIEHVAPRNDNKNEWDKEIYSRELPVVDVIGNLVLLPSLENSVVSDFNWGKKNLLYKALADTNQVSVENWIAEVKSEDIPLPTKVEENLRDRYGLSLLDSIIEVADWDRSFVVSRSQNLCQLCWDRLRPWLD